MRHVLSLFACLCLLAAVAVDARPLARDEQVLVLPTTARWQGDRIEARIDIWVYELESRPGLSSLFADYLDLDLDALPSADRQRFLERTQLFRVDSESFKDVHLRLGGRTHALPATGFDGRTRSSVGISSAGIAASRRWLKGSVVMPHGDPRQFKGRVLLVPSQGLSVVSDIDDTIKVSQVRERREMLLNTFAREFVAVPGMAARYRTLQAGEGTRFHYVSGSPVQLYPPLAVFLRTEGFPAGSVHLRESTSIRNVIPGSDATRTHKLAAIGQLLADFPQRRFLLVGDSGEADPEIYAELARAHPAQVAGIRIRDVTGEAADAPRYRVTFDGLPADLWQVYSDPQTLREP